MIELVFTACLAAAPLHCKDVALTFEAHRAVPPAWCAFLGQVEMAKWQARNPLWRPGRFKCAAVAVVDLIPT